MIFVRAEIWPWGNKARARVLGDAVIANTGKGTTTSGKYVFWISKVGGFADPTSAKSKEIWRRGELSGFPRLRLGVWDLLFRALVSAVWNRNKGVINAKLKEEKASHEKGRRDAEQEANQGRASE